MCAVWDVQEARILRVLLFWLVCECVVCVRCDVCSIAQ
jgi:hypothetical protein